MTSLPTNRVSTPSATSLLMLILIKWSFIPGRAPHFGGIWEASVKSARILLRKLVGSHILSVEECMSVLTDIEATMNSRPICALNSLPEDGVEVLTPGHFLVGRPLLAPPQLHHEELNISPKMLELVSENYLWVLVTVVARVSTATAKKKPMEENFLKH